MSNYLFKGPFAEHIENHVSLKKAIGYKYEAEARHLLRFSSFTEQKYPEATMLTKEIVLDWCSKKVMRHRPISVRGLRSYGNLPYIWTVWRLAHTSYRKAITPRKNNMCLISIRKMNCSVSSMRQINATMSVNVHIATSSCQYSFVWFIPVAFVPQKQDS